MRMHRGADRVTCLFDMWTTDSLRLIWLLCVLVTLLCDYPCVRQYKPRLGRLSIVIDRERSMKRSGLWSRRVKAKIKQVEPGVLLAPFDSFRERPHGAMITDRRKGTGKEQTFLAFKTLLQFSWARSHQRPNLSSPMRSK